MHGFGTNTSDPLEADNPTSGSGSALLYGGQADRLTAFTLPGALLCPIKRVGHFGESVICETVAGGVRGSKFCITGVI